MKNSRDKDIQEIWWWMDAMVGWLVLTWERWFLPFFPTTFQWHHADSLKWALEGEFTSEKLINTINQCLLCSFIFGKPISTLLGGHKEDGGDGRLERTSISMIGSMEVLAVPVRTRNDDRENCSFSPREWPCGLGCAVLMREQGGNLY